MVPFIVHDDVEAGVDMVRPFYALYFGGMGASGGQNFHANVAIRMGYERDITEIQDLYIDGKKDQAAARIPSELIQKLSLLGPPDKIRHDLEAWEDSFVTTLMISGDESLLRQVAEIVLA
jgi:Luciferase-like monooxygenase